MCVTETYLGAARTYMPKFNTQGKEFGFDGGHGRIVRTRFWSANRYLGKRRIEESGGEKVDQCRVERIVR